MTGLLLTAGDVALLALGAGAFVLAGGWLILAALYLTRPRSDW